MSDGVSGLEGGGGRLMSIGCDVCDAADGCCDIVLGLYRDSDQEKAGAGAVAEPGRWDCARLCLQSGMAFTVGEAVRVMVASLNVVGLGLKMATRTCRRAKRQQAALRLEMSCSVVSRQSLLGSARSRSL
jgi:hypothetical protein